jgi:hypothetical protein
MTDDITLENGSLNYVRTKDREHPDRICAWCHHPRNSDECQFAAKHTPYVERFAPR